MPKKDVSILSAQFARNLCRLRERARLTQEQLAEASGVSWRYLQQLEGGKEANPSLQILCGLKSALHCSWEELLLDLPGKRVESC